jgi:hypothetical protein
MVRRYRGAGREAPEKALPERVIAIRLERGAEPSRARLITVSRRSNARRRATRHRLDREAAFVAELEAYQHGGSPEAVLQAAGSVIDSNRPIAPEHADTISVVTDNLNITIKTYGDAAQAIRRWFAQMAESGARH